MLRLHSNFEASVPMISVSLDVSGFNLIVQFLRNFAGLAFSLVWIGVKRIYIFIKVNVFLQVMDKHMSILAKQHIETRFVKIQAEKSPFLAERLKIVVLPTLALIKNTKVDDYVV